MARFKTKHLLLILPSAALILSTLITSCNVHDASTTTREYNEVNYPQMGTISYLKEIQPIFNKRCATCHSCYDAPAQLNLSCPDGVLRGATKKVVYESRLRDVQPTRLHVDGKTEEDWRKLGFFSVLGKRESKSVSERLKTSLIYQMVSQTRVKNLPYDTSIAHLQLATHDPAIAPTIEEFPDFAANHPHSGMPFFTQRLSEKEFATISNWIAQGSPVEQHFVKASIIERRAINRWETYLNRDSIKSQLISRYLFEHLFISHLYFDDIPNSGYFKIVRSESAPGTPIKRVTTPLCNDDPKVDRVYYRIKKMHGIIKRKTHIAYPLSNAKLERYKSLFDTDDWNIEKLPDYSEANKVSPFVVFSDIPAKAKYQFMLDNSFFFVLSFIRGPVCRGQSALNAINDHFYIMFHSPDSKLAITDDLFLKANMRNMTLPGNIRSLIATPVSYSRITSARNTYLNNRTAYLNKIYVGDNKVSEKDIWAGDNGKSDPTLTVYRHFDTASVQSGFIGRSAATAWVLDYPTFERIYYSLVVNYNIFSTAGHQAATRLYFDLLRHESENNFLTFLPVQVRQSTQDEWYREVGLKGIIDYHDPSTTIGTATLFTTDKPGLEFVEKVKARTKTVARTSTDKHLDNVASTIPAETAPVVQFLPEMVLIKVTDSDPESKDQVYTMIRNKAHKNVAYIFDEESRREPERDNVIFIKGITGDYPNMMLVIPKAKLEEFKEQFHAADTREKIIAILKDYGILRNSVYFWQNIEWIQNYTPPSNNRDFGIFDLKNYYTY